MANQPPSGGCVLKRRQDLSRLEALHQPPSGGCVLKPDGATITPELTVQPPSGGCVLKRPIVLLGQAYRRQPPSGGCVLKLAIDEEVEAFKDPAAFGRLCVETADVVCSEFELCQPPSGGCVLKRGFRRRRLLSRASRLRAAVC